MSLLAVVRLIAGKDLRIEWRSRVVLHQVVPFSGLVMVLFAFALDNDATLTAALLDRLLHHVETIVIEGRSYRTKDQVNNP